MRARERESEIVPYLGGCLEDVFLGGSGLFDRPDAFLYSLVRHARGSAQEMDFEDQSRLQVIEKKPLVE